MFPRPPALAQLLLPGRAAYPDRRSGQPAARRGHGVRRECGSWSPGDRLRRINWPVTSHRGALHVNQFAAERAAEIVALIDAIADAGPPGDSRWTARCAGRPGSPAPIRGPATGSG